MTQRAREGVLAGAFASAFASAFAGVMMIVVAGCESREGVSPAPVDAGSGPPPAVSVKRTVMTRSPFGGAAGNLLIDGDFEMSSVASVGAQLGFRGFSADGSGSRVIPTETGGICRSGLRCAVLDSTLLAFVRGAAANGKGTIASMFAKPPEGSKCNLIRPIVITCDDAQVVRLMPSASSLDQGWCYYRAMVPESSSSVCLYIDNSLPNGQTAIVDAAVFAPDDGTVHPLAAEKWEPDAETLARLARLQSYLRGTMPVGKPRPSRPPADPW